MFAALAFQGLAWLLLHFKSTATAVAPSSAKRCAIARPMPWLRPVTTATFPAKTHSCLPC